MKTLKQYLESDLEISSDEVEDFTKQDLIDFINDLDEDDFEELLDVVVDYIADEEEEDDEDNEDDEETDEALKKKIVWRNGMKVKKWKTDKPGYKVKYVNGKPKEVKMTSKELMIRKKASKKAAIKRKSGNRAAAKKRAKTMKRRN